MADPKLYYPQCHAILRVVFDGFGTEEADSTPRTIPVRPKESTIVRNSYRQADSWELAFSAEDFPMDPRMVRTGQAEIWLYGSRGLEDRRLVESHSSLGVPVIPRSLLEAANIEAQSGGEGRGRGGQRIKRPTIAGLFDEHSIEYSSNGKWVSIHGQDYTALLIGKQWPPTRSGRARKIDVGRKLDVQLRLYLAEADPSGRLSIAVEGIPAAEMPRIQAGTVGNSGGIPIEQDTSYWDVMYKLAKRAGLILFVRGADVVLARPYNVGSHSVNRIRSMAWGKNIEHLEMARKLGSEKAPSVIVKGYDPKRKKTISAEWPRGTEAKTKERKESEYIVITAHETSDPKVLMEMARREFVMRGKSERTVRFRTRDLTDLRDVDLLDLSTGDSFDIRLEEWIRDSAAIKKSGLGFAQRVQYLQGRGYAPAVAKIIAEKYAQFDLLDRPLAVREVTYEYSENDGISIESELIDFIVIDGERDKATQSPRSSKERLTGSSSEAIIGRRQRRARRRGR